MVAKELLANNAPMASNVAPLSSAETMAIAQVINGDSKGEKPDPENVPSLNRQRIDRLRKQAELGSTGSIGRIKRR